MEKTTLLHKEEAEAKGEPPKPNDFATSHRDVVAKFGRCKEAFILYMPECNEPEPTSCPRVPRASDVGMSPFYQHSNPYCCDDWSPSSKALY